MVNRKPYPIEFEKVEGIDAELTDIIVPYSSEAIGKKISELSVPEKCLIMLISRNDKYVIPAGSTVIQGGDVLLVLANAEDFSILYHTIGHIDKKQE